MIKAGTFLLLLTLALSHSAQAAEPQANNTQTGLNQDAQLSYQKADSALHNAYQQLMTSLETDRHTQLEVAQQAWLNIRDAEAEFRSAIFSGGSIQPLIYNQALTELTEQRIEQLEALFQEQVGY